nr:unnamed protein product [Digitaria exilis]
MEAALEAARAKDAKERQAGVERLHEALGAAARRGLSAGEVTSLVDTCMDLAIDGNFRIAQGGLQALSAAAVLAADHFKIHLNALVPAAVERLGDGKQPVREAARQLLVTLMENGSATLSIFQVSSPTIIVERAGSYAWTHKSWRVREEFVRTVAAAVGLFASTELPLQRVLLSPVLQLMNDLNPSVRDAAISCIEEMYRNMGSQFHEELQRHNLPAYMLKEINSRLDKIEPNAPSFDGARMQCRAKESRSFNANTKRGSPRKKGTQMESTLFGGKNMFTVLSCIASFSFIGGMDINEKLVEPIRVHSEQELVRDFEKVASALNPEKDWSIRISAMQRIEALVYGGAINYPSFLMLLKQLACHLLNVLIKELLGDFEPFAEIFIPVLFKLVVITVLVIAESADKCIKSILRNCKVSRVLPLIADTAKNDRSAVLRARCCEYALLILEYWADAPEIHRSADLYENLIKSCVSDAMSEVRATARTCYRMFSKTWPERSRRLFMSFDSAIQRYFNQIFTTVIEVLDDVDSSVREVSLLLVAEMVQNQIDSMEESIEIILEKLLHMTKDNVGKVSNEAHQCLYIVLAKYDPLRCLAIIVPLLASDDEKTLVVCINCLTKLVGRLSQQELVTQLPSFLPAVFDAFNNQSPDVRKAVVFCLVDIYIILGKEFVPYLEGLSSMQLRLVTIYANRISQARSGAPADAAQ